MINQNNITEFYNGKKVLVTGCTGFKGSWLCQILLNLGSNVIGYSLYDKSNRLFNILNLKNKIKFIKGDIRNYKKIRALILKEKPDIIIHLAAQPLVIESYINPLYTFDVNVMGTVNICEILRYTNWNISFLNVTTDKVYKNLEKNYMYKEEDELFGKDPYSNSKSCSELVTYSYNESFFKKNDKISCSTCRSGNVIGGGDFSDNRIIPDCYTACKDSKELILRYPDSTRPYQHVLEPLFVYLEICMLQYINKNNSGSFNVGPDKSDITKTIDISKMFFKSWGQDENFKVMKSTYEESILLMLDNSKIKKMFKWEPTLSIQEAVDWTARWYKNFEENAISLTNKQIEEFMELKWGNLKKKKPH